MRSKSLPYISELDGLRGIAALMVVFFHAFQNSSDWGVWYKASLFGQSGVTLFFVLSGFLIGRILIETRDKEKYFLNFYARRTLRIFPLYFLFLGIFYLYMAQFPAMPGTHLPKWYFFVFLQNIPLTFNLPWFGPEHYWSLAIEEHFYLILPLAVYLIPNKKIFNFIIFIFIVSFCTKFLLLSRGHSVYYFTFSRFDELGFGVILALNEKSLLPVLLKKKFFLFGFLISSVVLAAVYTLFTGTEAFGVQLIKYFIIGFWYFSIIGLVILSRSKVFNFLNTKPFQYSGKISFGLYVFHPLIISIAANYIGSKNPFIILAASLFFTYIVATISFYEFEQPFLKLKRWFQFK